MNYEKQIENEQLRNQLEKAKQKRNTDIDYD